jgi:hypothetical protein
MSICYETIRKLDGKRNSILGKRNLINRVIIPWPPDLNSYVLSLFFFVFLCTLFSLVQNACLVLVLNHDCMSRLAHFCC